MAWFGDDLAKEALRQIGDHVKECKDNYTKMYDRMESTFGELEKKFDDAHRQNKKRLDAIVWSTLVGALSVILFLLDKIATSKGIWT